MTISAGSTASQSVDSLWVLRLSTRTFLLLREVDVGNVHEHAGKVLPGAAVGDLDMAPGEQQGMDHEKVGSAAALVLEAEPRRLPRAGRQGRPGLLGLLFRRLVKAFQDGVVVEVAVMDLEHVLHGKDEVGVRLRRNASGGLQPWLDAGLFSALRTASSEMPSTALSSTSFSQSSRSVQRTRPGGGFEQASITSFAFPTPSRRRQSLRCLRHRVRRRRGFCPPAGGCRLAAAPSIPCRRPRFPASAPVRHHPGVHDGSSCQSSSLSAALSGLPERSGRGRQDSACCRCQTRKARSR